MNPTNNTPAKGETVEQAATKHANEKYALPILISGKHSYYNIKIIDRYREISNESFVAGAHWMQSHLSEAKGEESEIKIDWKKHLSDAKDIAAKKHGYGDWYQIQCLDLDGYEKDEIRANLIDDVASFFEMLVCSDRDKQSPRTYTHADILAYGERVKVEAAEKAKTHCVKGWVKLDKQSILSIDHESLIEKK